MLPRTLEPELMDSADEAADYDTMDHAEVNERFVEDLLQLCDPTDATVLDVGTGTALIPIELLRRRADCRVTAIDAAGEMLRLANTNVQQAGLQASINLQRVDAKRLPYADGSFAVVMSNSIHHHIPEPLDILREMSRVLAEGGVLFVRDLLRPSGSTAVEHLVDLYAGEEHETQRQLFRQSLHAALTVDEVADRLESIGLPATWVQQTSDRHWTIAGRR